MTAAARYSYCEVAESFGLCRRTTSCGRARAHTVHALPLLALLLSEPVHRVLAQVWMPAASQICDQVFNQRERNSSAAASSGSGAPRASSGLELEGDACDGADEPATRAFDTGQPFPGFASQELFSGKEFRVADMHCGRLYTRWAPTLRARDGTLSCAPKSSSVWGAWMRTGVENEGDALNLQNHLATSDAF